VQASLDGLRSKPKSILGKLNAGRRDLWVDAPLRGLTNLRERRRGAARLPCVEECGPRTLSLNLAELPGREIIAKKCFFLRVDQVSEGLNIEGPERLHSFF
jgi:hypothetical protein